MGLVGLMNVLKLEGSRDGILVNAVAPIAATRMTETGYPKEIQPLLKVEFVSAAVAYLCSEACKVSGHVLSAGGGYFARAEMVEAKGVTLDPSRAGNPDEVASAFEAICDMSQAEGFASADTYVKKAFQQIRPE